MDIDFRGALLRIGNAEEVQVLEIAAALIGLAEIDPHVLQTFLRALQSVRLEAARSICSGFMKKACTRMYWRCRFAPGATATFSHRQRAESAPAMAKTGAERRVRLMPATRKPVISWSEDRRPNTSRMAQRKARGNRVDQREGDARHDQLTEDRERAPASTSSGRNLWKRLPITRIALSTTMAKAVLHQHLAANVAIREGAWVCRSLGAVPQAVEWRTNQPLGIVGVPEITHDLSRGLSPNS